MSDAEVLANILLRFFSNEETYSRIDVYLGSGNGGLTLDGHLDLTPAEVGVINRLTLVEEDDS